MPVSDEGVRVRPAWFFAGVIVQVRVPVPPMALSTIGVKAKPTVPFDVKAVPEVVMLGSGLTGTVMVVAEVPDTPSESITVAVNM